MVFVCQTCICIIFSHLFIRSSSKVGSTTELLLVAA